MKVRSRLLSYFHLDKTYSLLTAKNVKLLHDIFNILDMHEMSVLNDIQFYCFVGSITNLSRKQIYEMFDMLDVDGSGELDFDEFYLLMAIIIAVKDNEEKQFIYRHSRTVFDLMDEDGSNSISAHEFEMFGFMFNLQGLAVKKIFSEFDVSGDQELDYKEFRMFAMACIDKQTELENERKAKQYRKLEKKREREQRREQLGETFFERMWRRCTNFFMPESNTVIPESTEECESMISKMTGRRKSGESVKSNDASPGPSNGQTKNTLEPPKRTM